MFADLAFGKQTIDAIRSRDTWALAVGIPRRISDHEVNRTRFNAGKHVGNVCPAKVNHRWDLRRLRAHECNLLTHDSAAITCRRILRGMPRVAFFNSATICAGSTASGLLPACSARCACS